MFLVLAEDKGAGERFSALRRRWRYLSSA